MSYRTLLGQRNLSWVVLDSRVFGPLMYSQVGSKQELATAEQNMSFVNTLEIT